jgi:hypothetical protein
VGRGFYWGGGGVGAAIHCRLPKLCGLGALLRGFTCFLEAAVELLISGSRTVTPLVFPGGALVHPLPHFVPHPPPFFRF